MISVIRTAQDATPAWLTDALRSTGALPDGQVSHVEARPFSGRKADVIVPLHVRYEAPQHPPERLLLKLQSRPSEVLFNRQIAASMPEPAAVRCYYAAAQDDHVTLLFEDLSQTHYTAPEVLPPTRAEVAQMVATLARLHAFWWQHPRLSGDLGASAPDVDGFLLGRTHEVFPRFVDAVGDRFSPARRAIYERLLARLPLAPRHEGVRGLTITHGDSHAQNFILPRQAGGPALLIDCADWRIAPPANDLAFLLTLEMYPEWRARFEGDLLRGYHAELTARGVADYTWDDLRLDYRQAVLRCMLMPVFWWDWSPPELWWHPLEKVLAAYHDLDCEALL